MRRHVVAAWEHEGFKKYFANTGWLFAARMISYAVSFFTIAVVARYLGPENYGKLSYAQSFISLFSIFASLGIDNILYRDLIAHPEKEEELLGTAIVSRLLFGCLTIAVAVVASLCLDSDKVLTAMIAIISFTFIFQPFTSFNTYLNAKIASKYYAFISIFDSFFMAGLKLVFVYLGFGILYFASLLLLEAILFAGYYLVVYVVRFKGSLARLRFSARTCMTLFKDSWPLLLASVSSYFYGRIDQVMIQYFMDSASVGFYDAAMRLTEVWIFFPSLIISSIFPAVANAYRTDLTQYYQRFKVLSLLTLASMLCIVVPVFLLAPLIVHFVFGSAFAPTAGILRIYVWSGIGITFIALVQSYLVIENRGKQFFLITFAGALANIALNLFLIPHYGMDGAAIATLLSYGLMVIAFCAFRENRAGLLQFAHKKVRNAS